MSPRALAVPALLFAAAWSVVAPRSAGGANVPITDEMVNTSLKKGVHYLLDARNPQGTWEDGTNFVDGLTKAEGGQTCLALYALLHIGEMGEDPRLAPRSRELAPTVKYVVNLKADSVYAASLQASCLSLMPKETPGLKEAILRTHNYLIATTLQGGGHYYSASASQRNPGAYDHSNSNYALLGLAALADTGVPGTEVPANYWRIYEALWRRDQNKDGGWGYAPNRIRPETSAAMTAAGVASLLLCRQYTQTDVSAAPKPDKSLEAGLAMLSKTFDVSDFNLYYLYTLERIGLAYGTKYINTHDWYREGAALLMTSQDPGGAWKYSNGLFASEMNATVPTALALLFLARGRSPLLFNKLEYEGAWDARPRDDANATAFVARAFEKPLAWQSVKLRAHEDWLDAPVLLITGNRDPKFTDEQFAKIKEFVDAGGMVFSTADTASADFTRAMAGYAARCVESPAPMRELEADHPLYTLWANVERPPKLQGLSNGLREVWVHSPTDLGAQWQRNRHKDFKTPFEVAANLCYYVYGKSAPTGHRLDTLAVTPSTEEPTRTVKLARVKYNGTWDPEPGAWPRLAKVARAYKTKLDLVTTPLDTLDAKATSVAHLTGMDAVPLDDAARRTLVKFVEDGGTLIIDACGGTRAFSESMKASLPEIFKDVGTLEPIPADSPLFTGEVPDSVKIPAVEWRKYTRVRDNAIPGDKPRLAGIKKGDRWVVIFSGDDITSGLLGTNTWGIAGYAPESAQDLARNLLLYVAEK
jgi:hypothetical protein